MLYKMENLAREERVTNPKSLSPERIARTPMTKRQRVMMANTSR
jgi:hypothetical protein